MISHSTQSSHCGSMPHISKREWIKWPPEPESEPTNTLVLTSNTGKFIDIRVLKRDARDEAGEDVLPLSRLDWAFAGTATTKLDPNAGGKRATGTWNHCIDSRTDSPEDVEDTGEILSMPDGTSLEAGKMVNPDRPADGEVSYEELWKDVLASPVAELPCARLEDANGASASEASQVPLRICIVIELKDEHDRARGMVVRVGQFLQGIFKLTSQSGREPGVSTTVERWAWSERLASATEGGGDGRVDSSKASAARASKDGWQRQLRIGDYWLPCGFAMGVEEGKVRVGQEIVYGEFEWKVVELSYF
ncbi:Protein HRI1 [Teratosphaeria destructans]|uniref:Protein HRI1 n=1 Tax=Teratosphaeria destructans TaxID=418781 RepID=A0A9W7SKZ9_9PEZI|nr:Protein HRI1 [Teratosphaeria destructans]